MLDADATHETILRVIHRLQYLRAFGDEFAGWPFCNEQGTSPCRQRPDRSLARDLPRTSGSSAAIIAS